jgi:Putative lumazine-binding
VSAQSDAGKRLRAFPFIAEGIRSTIQCSRTSMRLRLGGADALKSEVRTQRRRGRRATSPRRAKRPANRYLVEHDAITRTMDRYVAGARAGDGDLMRPAFHREATMSGYCQGVEYSGSIEHVFAWVTANGPAPNIEPRFARIEIIETIALVHLEVRGWSGKLAGVNSHSRASDVFTLLKLDGEWKITHKLFHWHSD